VKKFTAGKVAAVVLVGGLAIGFGSVAATVANAAVGDILADSFGNMFGDFGGDAASCCCFDLGGCEDLSCLGDCCGCFGDIGCDSCGDLCGGCGDLMGGPFEMFFECICGLLSGI